MSPLQSNQVIGTYRVLRLLGEGGMGAVYEAEHLSIARRVAIKVLHPSCSNDPDSLARFYNEARAANLIDHPSVVQVLDYGRQEDGSSYFVMELLKGETLRSRITRSQHGIFVDEALRIGRQMSSTLAAAHDCGIIHRDLKPENIMLVPDPEATDGQRVKILDFGIAKLAQWVEAAEVRTRTNMIVGTPAYMAPEQCRGAALVDDRADVYSLGVVLFELLAGRRPFLGSSAGECMGQHLFCDPPALDTVTAGIPAELAALIATLLSKDREARPHMAQVLTSLEAMCAARRASDDAQRPEPPASGISPPPRSLSSPKNPQQAGKRSPALRASAKPQRSFARTLALSSVGILGVFVARGDVAKDLRTKGGQPADSALGQTASLAPPTHDGVSAVTSTRPRMRVDESPPSAVATRAPLPLPPAVPAKPVLTLGKRTGRTHEGSESATSKRSLRSHTGGGSGSGPERSAAVSLANDHHRPPQETKNNEILED